MLESGIGQPLRARVPVSLQTGEELSTECVSLVRPPDGASDQHLTRAALEVTGNGREIVISTAYSIQAPVAQLRLSAGCGAAVVVREYTLLLDPPELRPPTPPPPPRVSPAPAPRPLPDSPRARWELRPGDTAHGLAAAVYPGAPALQERLADAIVSANPEAFADGDPAKPATGKAIAFPDLRTIGLKGAFGTAAAKRTAPKAPAAAVPDAVPVPERKTQPSPSPPATAPVPERRREPGPEERSVPALATGRADGAGSRLQLSSADRGLVRGIRLSEAEQALLQELQKLETDDQMSRILALKQRVADLETQFAVVRARFEREAERAPMPPTATVAPAGVETDLRLPLLGAGLGAAILIALFFARRQLRKAQQDVDPRGAAAVPLPAPISRQAPDVTKPLPVAAVTEPKAVAEKKPGSRSADSTLEEAQLLMIHGHPLRAINLLEEHIETNGGEVRLWMLLFVLLRSQNMKKEFARFIPKFSATKPDPELWENIQALGQEMDPQNPLYASYRSPAGVAQNSEPRDEPSYLDSLIRRANSDGDAPRPASPGDTRPPA